MVVACEDRDTGAGLPVPYPDGLIITCCNNPGGLMMELYCADVVQVAKKGEEATAQLVVPYLNLIVITCIQQHRLYHKTRIKFCDHEHNFQWDRQAWI